MKKYIDVDIAKPMVWIILGTMIAFGVLVMVSAYE